MALEMAVVVYQSIGQSTDLVYSKITLQLWDGFPLNFVQMFMPEDETLMVLWLFH